MVMHVQYPNTRPRQRLAVLMGLVTTLSAAATLAQNVLLEAEQFTDIGGWVIDQQSMDQMGSPYLLAHGLGVAVADAATTVTFPKPGTYRLWVRTRDWAGPWKAPGAPGRFRLLVDGRPAATEFGTEGSQWHWQDGGIVTVSRETAVRLHDLTGFEGRCDAILFCHDAQFQPPNGPAALARFRRSSLALPERPEDGGRFDLVVVGGGIAGTCTALSAARQGLAVALVQDRPVLGGNASSEIRVWPEGAICQQPYPHVGDVVAELVPEKTAKDGNAKAADRYADDRKLAVVRAEPRITLLTELHVNQVETAGRVIRSVVGQDVRTGRRLRLTARLFADCTGDGTVGVLAGADHEVFKEGVMGASNLWNLVVTEANEPAPFPRCPWALDLTDRPFPGRKDLKGQWQGRGLENLGTWFWESGFDKDMVGDIEAIRDLNLRAMYGAWDALKNVDHLYPNHRLQWAAFIAGKRESRRLLGDVILTADDFRRSTEFPDGCFPCSWNIDVHTPHPDFDDGLKGQEFISQATTGKGYEYRKPYWAPYRTLYSRSITNLFMAGRDISATHEGLGPVRVMRTCGMMGEIVGKAAWICLRHSTTPRGVYEKHLPLLKELMSQPGGLRRATLRGELSAPASSGPAETTTGRDSR